MQQQQPQPVQQQLQEAQQQQLQKVIQAQQQQQQQQQLNQAQQQEAQRLVQELERQKPHVTKAMENAGASGEAARNLMIQNQINQLNQTAKYGVSIQPPVQRK